MFTGEFDSKCEEVSKLLRMFSFSLINILVPPFLCYSLPVSLYPT